MSNFYEHADNMLSDFAEGAEMLDGVDVLAVFGGSEYYEEWLDCIYRKDGKFYSFSASHCSCFGFEGQWCEDEIGLRTVKHLANEASECLRKCARWVLTEIGECW